jgi:hypothetical protein
MSNRTTVNKLEDSGEIDATVPLDHGDRRAAHIPALIVKTAGPAAWSRLPVAKISRSLVERGLMEC